MRSNISWPQAAVIIAFLIAFVAIAAIDTGVAIFVAIIAWLTSDSIFSADLFGTAEQSPEQVDAADALTRLRGRYADGQLSEEEFEQQLEVLLRTETIEDVEAFLNAESTPDGDSREVEHTERR